MSSIISSTLTVDTTQIDGRRSVLETHTDDIGNTYQISYMADSDMDVDIRMRQHASDLNAQLQVSS